MKKSFSDKTPKTCCYRRHAVLFGYIEAVLIHHFMYWIDFNRKKKQHLHDDRYWTYSSVSTLHKSYFPFFSEGQIRRAIDSLHSENVIIKGNYNKMKYDKTTWYALTDEDRLAELAIPFDEYDRSDELS
tara:strand:+ start:135 stop:521 length:387 start_codon:yes stop_codon:yes gene_type:complete